VDRAGGIEHPPARLGHEAPRQRVGHPVARADPGAVIRPRRALEPGAHRHEILERQVGHTRVGTGRDQPRRHLAQSGAHARHVAPVDRGAKQRRDKGLRNGLDIDRPGGGRPGKDLLHHRLAALRHHEAVQLVEAARQLERVGKPLRRAPARTAQQRQRGTKGRSGNEGTSGQHRRDRCSVSPAAPVNCA